MTSQIPSSAEQAQQPLVSVIMNCYNGEPYLREAIDSVYAQTYTNWEIVFWDNASTDGTQRIATSYDSRIKYFRAETNTPLGPARNMALKKASGTYMAFLDSDDVFLPCALQQQVTLMESGDYGLVYAGTIVIDEKGKVIGFRKVKYESGRILDSLLRKYEISMCSVMLRRSVLESERLEFDASLGYCPDYSLFMKIAAQYRVGVMPDPIVKYRRSSNSLSRKTLHLAAKENRQVLYELETLYPNALRACGEAMAGARSKLKFYEAVYRISTGEYSLARSELRPVIGRRWEFLVLYLALFLPIPRSWMLRLLNR